MQIEQRKLFRKYNMRGLSNLMMLSANIITLTCTVDLLEFSEVFDPFDL
jgi:hypothetical protein